MAITPNVAFPTWTAMRDSIQLDLGSEFSLYIGDRVNIGDRILDPIGAGRAFSIILICTIDSSGGFILQLKDLVTSDTSLLIRTIGLSLFTEANFNETKLLHTGNIVLGGPIHIVYTEQGPSAVGGAKSQLFINGVLSVSTAVDFVSLNTNFNHLILGSSMKIAGLRLYDRILTSAQILEDFNRASAVSDVTDVSTIEKIRVQDVLEQEFNGTFKKDTTSALTFIDGNSATYKILDYINSTSFGLDPTSGLPIGGWGHFGSYVLFEGDNFNEGFQVISVISTGTEVEVEINRPATFIVGDIAAVQGITFTTAQDPNPFAGTSAITTVVSTTKFRFASTFTNTAAIILDTDTPKIFLDAPPSFIPSEDISGDTLSPVTSFTGLQESKEYTVRVRAQSTWGDLSPWLADSIIVSRNDLKPFAIYTTVAPATNGVRVNLHFGKDLVGSVSSTFHIENNAAYAEVVVARNNTDRHSGGVDPGPEVPDPNAERVVHRVTLPPDIIELEDISVVIPVLSSFDMYIWTRLVSTSGETSNWYLNDSGTSAERDRFAVTPVLIGIGPVRAIAGSSGNALPPTEAENFTISTTTADSEGPAPTGGTGGFYP